MVIIIKTFLYVRLTLTHTSQTNRKKVKTDKRFYKNFEPQRPRLYRSNN